MNLPGVARAAAPLALFIALLWSFLSPRIHTASIFYKNAPERFKGLRNIPNPIVKFGDRIRSCEDVILVESRRVAILGCDPGRERWNTVMGIFEPEPVANADLYLYDYSKVDELLHLKFVNFKHQTNFHTLGMAYDEHTSTLFVANHRRNDHAAIEMFKLDLDHRTATHLGSIQHRLIHGPNSIALINDHELMVTNNNHFLFKDHWLLNRIETYLALPLGSVVHVDFAALLKDPHASVDAKVIARLPFANGIEMVNETEFAVASSSLGSVHMFDLTTSKELSRFTLPFHPDNLSKSSDGALFIAGHPHMPTLAAFTKSRHICNDPNELSKADTRTQEACKTSSAPSWAVKWTEAGGVEHLYASIEYPSSATVVFDATNRKGVIAGLYAKGILVWDA
ncbi:putative paraoxonase [Xylariaceae sp. FL1272]|nr:putative paraoxonase [Xylariaceae sp. FL1272]